MACVFADMFCSKERSSKIMKAWNNPFHNTLPGSKGRMANSRWDMLIQWTGGYFLLMVQNFFMIPSSLTGQFQWNQSALGQVATESCSCCNLPRKLAPETDQCSLQRGARNQKERIVVHTLFSGDMLVFGVTDWLRSLTVIHPLDVWHGSWQWNHGKARFQILKTSIVGPC